MLNKQGPGKIDWTTWSLNPLPGCLHGCQYCYMHRMEKRFPGIMAPSVKLERLKALESKKLKPGDKVFVGSSGDMWGDWVKKCDIRQVLSAVADRKDVVFQFLTKNPSRYKDFNLDFYKNCWFGTTVDGTYRTQDNLFILSRPELEGLTRFVSFEPLLERPLINISFFKNIDWIIIGADSTRGAKRPPNEWADYLISTARNFNIPVWVKDNYGYGQIIKEFPI